jgi:hypothetical protein
MPSFAAFEKLAFTLRAVVTFSFTTLAVGR